MSTNNFPEQNKKYIQNNRTNVYPLGNIWSTYNIDLQSNLGAVRVSPAIKLNAATNNVPVAFWRFGSRIFTVAGTTIYRNTDSSGLPNDLFVADTSASASTDYSSDYSDMLGAWNSLYATSTTKLRRLSDPTGGTWSDVATIIGTLNHKMVYFKKFDRLYFTDQTIKSVNEAGTVLTSGDYTLPGLNTYGIVDMKATSGSIWIATRTKSILDQSGSIWQWDGISQQITTEYKIPGARAILKLIIDPSSDAPYALTDKGILYKYNGSGFVRVGQLPYKANILPYEGSNPVGEKNDAFIHPNGAYFTQWDTIRFLINGRNGDSTASQDENLPSGIWEWSDDFGFTHIGSPSYTVTNIAGLSDFGQEKVERVGAIADMNIPSTAADRNGTMNLGVTVYTSATTSTSNVFYDDSNNTLFKKGYVVTDWFESDEIANSWDVFWMSYRQFLDQNNDNITVKYRCVEETPVEATVTWVSNKSFTVLNSAVDVSKYWTSGTGGEVEFLRGAGAGSCSHIINAVNNAGTWTVTLDENPNLAVVSTTATARFQKWIKLFPAAPLTGPVSWAQFAIGTNSTPRIQIKMCFTYIGNGEFYKAKLTSNEDITTKNK